MLYSLGGPTPAHTSDRYRANYRPRRKLAEFVSFAWNTKRAEHQQRRLAECALDAALYMTPAEQSLAVKLDAPVEVGLWLAPDSSPRLSLQWSDYLSDPMVSGKRWQIAVEDGDQGPHSFLISPIFLPSKQRLEAFRLATQGAERVRQLAETAHDSVNFVVAEAYRELEEIDVLEGWLKHLTSESRDGSQGKIEPS